MERSCPKLELILHLVSNHKRSINIVLAAKDYETSKKICGIGYLHCGLRVAVLMEDRAWDNLYFLLMLVFLNIYLGCAYILYAFVTPMRCS